MALYFEGSKSITLSQHKSLSFLSFKKCCLTHPSPRRYVPPPSASRVSHHTSLCPDDMHSPLPLLSTTGLAHCSAAGWHGGAQYQFYVHRPHRLEATTEVTTESPRWSHKHPAGFCYGKKKDMQLFGCNTFAKSYGIESFFVSQYRENYQFEQ